MIRAARVAKSEDATSHAPAIVQPGRNCWRVEHADRFYCIQDAADHFRLVRQAILSARHTVFILGWDIFAAVDLVPGAAASDAPTRLDELLAFVARRRPHLRCYVLIWDYAALYTLERDPFSRWKLGWRQPRGVRFGFDDRIPLGGSHHQKIVVVDDQLAFCGGIDLTGHRWDTSAHRVDEPLRTSGGEPYTPYHEVHAMATGPLATALGELSRDRWRALGEKRMPKLAPSREDLWPSEITPDLMDVDVAIARTVPEVDGQPATRECEALFLDSIARARQSIYIESQYFTNDALADALAARLREPHGPEIIVVSPKECHGWIEQNTMGAFRNAAFRRMLDADKYQRLRLVHPAASRSRDVATFIHSKVMVVDDELARIGSANLSRRSMAVDSECDLAVEACGDLRVQEGIRHIRDRLLAEHLGLEVEAVRDGIERARSLRAFIDTRQDADRTLERLELTSETEAPSEALRAAADPDEPILSGLPIADLAPTAGATKNGRRRGFVLATNVVLVPPSLVAAVAGLLLGTIRGAVVALLVSLILAAIGYAAGRSIGPDKLQRWMSRRSYRSARQVGAQGLTGVIVLRLASVASAGAIHLLCGAARLPLASFLAGTAIGLAPATFAVAGLGALLHRTLQDPSLLSALTVIVAAVLLLTVAAGIRTVLLIRRFAPSVRSHRTRAEFG
jgi:phospholipase D1/2